MIQLQNILVFTQKFYGIKDHIVKIHSVRFQQFFLIEFIALRDPGFAKIILRADFIFGRVNQAVLRRAHFGKNGFVVQDLIRYAKGFLAVFHHTFLVIRIIDCKMGSIAEPVRKPP